MKKRLNLANCLLLSFVCIMNRLLYNYNPVNGACSINRTI